MKLTNAMRDAFVRAVMDDVPSIDYEEQIRQIVQQTVYNAMPAKLKAVWDDEALRDCVGTHWMRIVDCMSVTVPYYPSYDDALKSVKETCEALHKLHHEQLDKRCDLKATLYGVVRGKTTTKALIEALPQFEKYVPKDPQVSRNVPALANVLEAFAAAGWPKEQVA